MNKLKNISLQQKTAAKMTLRYILSLIKFEVSYFLLNLLFLYITGVTNLDQTPLFVAFKPWMLPMVFVVSIVGCIYVSYRYLRKPLEYLHEVSDATKQLAHPTQAPIVLSADLSDVQNNLNNVREQALMDRQAVRDAERQKNDLLVYLAHDLKTPLTSVLGYLRLIEDEENLPPELIAKYSGVARRKAERLDELINEFFTIARFTATKLTLEPAKVNLSRMLTQITFEFNPVLKEKGLEWDLQIPENIEIICDSDKLERTFDNLIRNAVNYGYENTTILCSLAQSPDSVRINRNYLEFNPVYSSDGNIIGNEQLSDSTFNVLIPEDKLYKMEEYKEKVEVNFNVDPYFITYDSGTSKIYSYNANTGDSLGGTIDSPIIMVVDKEYISSISPFVQSWCSQGCYFLYVPSDDPYAELRPILEETGVAKATISTPSVVSTFAELINQQVQMLLIYGTEAIVLIIGLFCLIVFSSKLYCENYKRKIACCLIEGHSLVQCIKKHLTITICYYVAIGILLSMVSRTGMYRFDLKLLLVSFICELAIIMVTSSRFTTQNLYQIVKGAE